MRHRFKHWFARQSLERLHAEMLDDNRLRRVLGPSSLTALVEEMVNIGTLMAFVIVGASVLILRRQRPDAERPFRCPLIYLVAPLGILVNGTMMLFLPLDTWIRLFVWLGVGLVIYFLYGQRHSVLARGNA